MNEAKSTSSSGALAVIIGRAGSKGLPGKNAMTIAGEPMICHTIRDAKDARCIERIVVSTDSNGVARAAASLGVKVIERPADLASDRATVQDAVRHAVTCVEESGTVRARYEAIVIMYANVPVRPDDLIDRAFDRLMMSGCDSVQSYADVGKHHPYWMVALDDEGRVRSYVPQPSGSIDRRQDLPKLLIPDGGVIVVRRSCLMRDDLISAHDFLGEDRRGVETRPGEVVDIDSPFDFAVAEAILSKSETMAAEVVRA